MAFRCWLLAVQGSGVRERAQLLADLLGAGVIAFELDPLALALREQRGERGIGAAVGRQVRAGGDWHASRAAAARLAFGR